MSNLQPSLSTGFLVLIQDRDFGLLLYQGLMKILAALPPLYKRAICLLEKEPPVQSENTDGNWPTILEGGAPQSVFRKDRSKSQNLKVFH